MSFPYYVYEVTHDAQKKKHENIRRTFNFRAIHELAIITVENLQIEEKV